MTILQEPAFDLSKYAEIPSLVEIESRLDACALEQDRFVELPEPGRTKDYDELEPVVSYPRRFDTTDWAAFRAVEGPIGLGGALVAWNCPGFDMLEGRTDIAVLVDIRVRAEAQRKGVGAALFNAAKRWAEDRGCREMKIETQDVNVAACRFYRAMGCSVGSVNAHAYDLPETQVIWRIVLGNS